MIILHIKQLGSFWCCCYKHRSLHRKARVVRASRQYRSRTMYTCGTRIISTPLLQNGPAATHTFSNKLSAAAAAAAAAAVSYNFPDKLQVRLIMQSISVIRRARQRHGTVARGALRPHTAPNDIDAPGTACSAVTYHTGNI